MMCIKSVDTFKQVLGAHKGQGISELYEKAIWFEC